MGKKFHVKPDGDVGVCRAFVKCPFGGDEDRAVHFPQEDWARKAFELKMEREALGDVAARPASLANYSQEDREALVGTYVYHDASGYGKVSQVHRDEDGLYFYNGYVKKERIEADRAHFDLYPLDPALLEPAMPMAAFNEELRIAAEPFKPRNQYERGLHYTTAISQDFDFATGSFPQAEAVNREIEWYRTKGVEYAARYFAENAATPDDYEVKYWDEEIEKSGTLNYPVDSSLPRIAAAIKHAQDRGVISEVRAMVQLRHAADLIRDRAQSQLYSLRSKLQPLREQREQEQVWLDDLREGSVHRPPHEAKAAELDASIDRIVSHFEFVKTVHDEAETVWRDLVENAYEVGRKTAK